MRRGWPATYLWTLEYFHMSSTSSYTTRDVLRVSWFACVVDATISIILLASTGIAVELFLRRPHPFQFGVRSLLVVPAVVAYVLLLEAGGIIEWEDLIYLPVGFSSLG